MNNKSNILAILSVVHCMLGEISIIGLASFLLLFSPIFLSSDSVNGVWNIAILLSGLVCSICLLLSGISMAAKKNYYFSLILACLECIALPLLPLSILGLITVFILTQDSIKILYRLK